MLLGRVLHLGVIIVRVSLYVIAFKMVNQEAGWDSEKPGYDGLIEVANRLMMKGRTNSDTREAAVILHCLQVHLYLVYFFLGCAAINQPYDLHNRTRLACYCQACGKFVPVRSLVTFIKRFQPPIKSIN